MKAERLEREITNLKSDNMHLKEERGQIEVAEEDETGMYEANEEMKYSGVVREEPIVFREEPRKRFTCKNKALSESTLTSMASSYLITSQTLVIRQLN